MRDSQLLQVELNLLRGDAWRWCFHRDSRLENSDVPGTRGLVIDELDPLFSGTRKHRWGMDGLSGPGLVTARKC